MVLAESRTYTCQEFHWKRNQYNGIVTMPSNRSDSCELYCRSPENLNHKHVYTKEKIIDLKMNVPYRTCIKKTSNSIKSIDRFDILNSTNISSFFMPSATMIKTVPATIQVSIHKSGKNERMDRQFKRKWCGNKFLVTRCATIIVLSAILLLSPAQGMNNNTTISFISSFPNTSRLNFNNTRLESATGNVDPEVLDPRHHIEAYNETKDLLTDPEAKIVSKVDTATSGSLNRQDARLTRNSLFGGINLLQRQLREKAKQDSLESIKMHILMRLNLKMLPNITKPIAIPQNILINFYKSYNTSFDEIKYHERSSSTSKSHLHATEESIKGTHSQTTNSESTHRNPINRSHSKTEDIFSEVDVSSEMQGDDANAFNNLKLVYKIGLEDNENTFDNKALNDNIDDYESILSHISSVYVFPEQPHIRNNHKTDILRFKFDNTYSEISYMTLHLYLRGFNWIGAHLPEFFNGMTKEQRYIVVSIVRILHQTNITSSAFSARQLQFRFKIPPGLGEWVKINLKPFFGDSVDGTYNSHDFLIKGAEPWMKPLFVTTDNATKNPLTVHIEIGSQKKHRRKRSVYMDCAENDQDVRCCRYPLKVNFTTFGWHFVVAPTSFDAYFCSGDCRVGYLEQYTHTHLTSLTTSASPCCSPTKMSSLSLLYFDYNNNLVLSVIPNMSVEGCSCS